MRLHVLEDAEVDDRDPLRRPALGLAQRPFPCLQVDLGRRRRREHELPRRDAHTDGVAGVERAVPVEVRHVVPGVPGAREALEAQHVVTDEREALRPGRARARPTGRRRCRRRGGERWPRAGTGRGGEVRRPPRREPAARGARGRARLRRRRGRGGCATGAGGRRRSARGRAPPGPASSAGTQVVGPQSKSASPSSVSTRYDAITCGSPPWCRSIGSTVIVRSPRRPRPTAGSARARRCASLRRPRCGPVRAPARGRRRGRRPPRSRPRA